MKTDILLEEPEGAPQDASYSEEKKEEKEVPQDSPRPEKYWNWQHPFKKGFMYTAGVASAILVASIVVNVIKLCWEDFEMFSILRSAPSPASNAIPLEAVPTDIDATPIAAPPDSAVVDTLSDSTSIP